MTTIVFGPDAYALSDWMTTLDDEDVILVSEREVNQERGIAPVAVTGGRLVARGNSLGPINVVCAAVVSENDLLVNDRNTREQVLVNCQAYVDLVQQVLPFMVKAKYGRFVYLSSFRSVTPAKGAVLYGACKAFGEALFAGINEEYGSRNIKAWSLRLGYLDGGLQGPRPEWVHPLTPKVVATEINRCLTGGAIDKPDGGTINIGDHR